MRAKFYNSMQYNSDKIEYGSSYFRWAITTTTFTTSLVLKYGCLSATGIYFRCANLYVGSERYTCCIGHNFLGKLTLSKEWDREGDASKKRKLPGLLSRVVETILAVGRHICRHKCYCYCGHACRVAVHNMTADELMYINLAALEL